MENSKVIVHINPDFLSLLNKKDDCFDEVANVSLAIYLFTAKKVTLARASELAGKNLADFIQILIDHHIHWAEYTDEHTKQDDETIKYILKEAEKND